MYTISKSFSFSASHQLAGLPADHPCTRLHGHNYDVTLILGAEALDDTGFVVDYRALSSFKQYLDQHFDHQHLNDQVDFNPTAENLAHFLYYVAVELFGGAIVQACRVSETPKTQATFSTYWSL